MTVTLTITQTMLNKYIIDCPVSLRLAMQEILGGDCMYDSFLDIVEKLPWSCVFELPDGTTTTRKVNFYKTKRGDKRISIKGLRQFAKAGDVLTVTPTPVELEEVA